jgi:glucan phosphoethanolaminetransferase (alkaline phosphatase superfamily)
VSTIVTVRGLLLPLTLRIMEIMLILLLTTVEKWKNIISKLYHLVVRMCKYFIIKLVFIVMFNFKTNSILRGKHTPKEESLGHWVE